MSKQVTVNDFWSPHPGAMASIREKIGAVVEAYNGAGLLNLDPVIPIRMGIDGSNLWKAKFETLTISPIIKESM